MKKQQAKEIMGEAIFAAATGVVYTAVYLAGTALLFNVIGRASSAITNRFSKKKEEPKTNPAS